VVLACIDHLVAVLDNVGDLHFYAPGNHLPLFPDCVGSVDTFPVRAYQKSGMYSGKYKAPVFKFQVVISNLGFVTQIAGPFKGSGSDTTIYRENVPDLPPSTCILGDKAYISVEYVMPPIKENNRRYTKAQKENFNKRMGHYRSRVEQSIRMLKQWACLGARWRHKDEDLLRKCAFVVASLRNMYCEEIAMYDSIFESQ
jgi:hypothetical protein